jgi:hypothetical protein
MRIGEHVAFKPDFARRSYGRDISDLRGFVYRLDGMIAAVKWTNGDGPDHALVQNLVPVSKLGKFK